MAVTHVEERSSVKERKIARANIADIFPVNDPAELSTYMNRRKPILLFDPITNGQCKQR